MTNPQTSHFSLEPGAGFSAEVLADASGLTDVLSFVPRQSGFASAAHALTLLISPDDADSWIGCFEGGYPSPKALTLVRGGARLGDLLVVNRGAGFVVPVTEPTTALDLGMTPIVGVLVDRRAGLVVAADFTNVAAFGAVRLHWTTEVSWDGVELHAIEDEIVTGMGWDAPTGRHVPFAVDLHTGQLVGGPTPRP